MKNMSNKGYQFEAQITDTLRELFKDILNDKNKIFRVIGSGRNKLATKTGEDTILEGDVSVELEFLPKNLLIECKHHKSKAGKGKSHPLKKEWVDQALSEAIKNGRLSIVAIKFKSTSPNSKEFQQYEWYDGHFGNTIHYIIPEPHFKELLSWFKDTRIASINNKDMLLNQLSDEELIDELKRRLGRKVCSNKLLQNGVKDDCESIPSGTENDNN
jgi:hypothetical protein